MNTLNALNPSGGRGKGTEPMSEAEVSLAYDSGKKYGVTHRGKVIRVSKNHKSAVGARNRLKGKVDLKHVKVVELKDVVSRVKMTMNDEKYAREVQRIIELTNPVTELEMETVYEVAADNVMKKDLEDIVVNAIMTR